MPVYTTYLGFLNKHGGADKVAQEIGSCFVYFVMRKRGNDSVAPTHDMLDRYKGNKDWLGYEREYKERLQGTLARLWMQRRAQEARDGLGNVLLVCYEKDASRCHRRLLAEEIAKRFGVEYKGEVT